MRRDRGDLRPKQLADQQQRHRLRLQQRRADVLRRDHAQIIVLVVHHDEIGPLALASEVNQLLQRVFRINELDFDARHLPRRQPPEQRQVGQCAQSHATPAQLQCVDTVRQQHFRAGGGNDGCEHDRQNDLVVARHLEQDHDGGQRSVRGGRDHGRHADQRVCRHAGVFHPAELFQQQAKRPAHQSAEQQRRRKHAPRAARAQRQARGHQLQNCEHQQQSDAGVPRVAGQQFVRHGDFNHGIAVAEELRLNVLAGDQAVQRPGHTQRDRAEHRLERPVQIELVEDVLRPIQQAYESDSDEGAEAPQHQVVEQLRADEVVSDALDVENGEVDFRAIFRELGLQVMCRRAAQDAGKHDRRERAKRKIAQEDFQREQHTGDGGVKDRSDPRRRAAGHQHAHLPAVDLQPLPETTADGGADLDDRPFRAG